MPIRPAITARNGPKTSIRRATTCDPNRSGPAPNRTVFCGPEIDHDCSSFCHIEVSSAIIQPLINVETVDLSARNFQLPADRVGMVIAQPFLSLTDVEPYRCHGGEHPKSA